MTKITKNAIQCNHCGDIVESRWRHYVHRCACGRVSVDGGLNYLRRSYVEEGDYMELAEYDEGEENVSDVH